MKSDKKGAFLISARWLLRGSRLEEVEGQSLLIRDSRIAWIGPAAEAPDAADAEVIDLGEATLLPGLIDAHMHTFGLDSTGLESMDLEREPYRALRAAGELRELLRAGFTTARCLGSSIGPDLARAIREGHVPGPRLLAAGAFVSTTGGTWDAPPLPAGYPPRAASVADGPEAMRRIVRDRVRHGADFIKLGLSKGRPGDRNHAWGDDPHRQVVTMTLEEVRAATDEAHVHGLQVSAHAIGEAAVVLALEGGIDTIEHGYGITGPTRQRLADEQRPVVTTLSQLDFHRLAYEPFRYSLADREIYDRHWTAMQADFVAGLAAGVRFILGTDLVGKPTHPLAEAATEVMLAVGLGMDLSEALRACTSVSAAAIGLGDETGQLSPGFSADVIAVRGRPLRDASALMQAPMLVMPIEMSGLAPGRQKSTN